MENKIILLVSRIRENCKWRQWKGDKKFGTREQILNHNVWEEVFTGILSIVTQVRQTHHPWYLMAVNYDTIWLNTTRFWFILITWCDRNPLFISANTSRMKPGGEDSSIYGMRTAEGFFVGNLEGGILRARIRRRRKSNVILYFT